MPPKRARLQPVDVVTIDSSDDEDSAPVITARNPIPPPQPQPRQKASELVSPPVGAPNLECRSFWKAGGYEIGPIARKAPAQGELEHARVHPKFLHSNATSHKWAFGAIAELLDNAVDEIHNGATFVKIDKVDIVKDNSPALLFLDDGGGMDPDAIRKCMSLGYSSKKSNTTIGQYGNGFKTSTMRLGADVIVFSRATCASSGFSSISVSKSFFSKATQSVGLLSYTFLRKTGQDDVIVPMIDFDISGSCAEPIIYSSQDDWSSNLKTILEWSPFASKDDLMQQFEDIGQHGTKIIIYNLWLNDEGIYELSFDDDDEDIRLRDETNPGDQIKIRKTTAERQSHISYQLRYSLRAYASILYLRKFKKFNILLRGKPVQQFNIADEMKHMKKVAYKPQGAVASNEVTVQTIIGFVKEAPALAVCGFNVYHKNRLIRPFWKVIGDGSARGNGVVGVLEANFIEPAHDKQDFERSSLFIRLEARLRHILLDYWKNHCHFVGHATPGSSTRNIQSGATTKTQKQLPASQRSVGLPAHVQEEANLDQPTTSIPTDLSQHMSNGHHVSNVRDESSVATVPGSTSIEQMCEENIQLFMRCEEYMQQETELKVTVEQLEKELEQEKRKCEQLAAHIEVKRKQRSMREQTGKVS